MQPSPKPTALTAGLSTDRAKMPLENFGLPNPFFYHVWEDDFDVLNPSYTATKTGNGTIAATAVDGGRLLFTTNSTTPATTDLCSLQLPAASFSFTAGKKSFFLARLQLADATNSALVIGLIQTTATPFTVTDGLYFKKASGSTALVLASMKGSAETDIATGVNLADATDIDVGFYVDYKQEVQAFAGNQYVGYTSLDAAMIGPQGRGSPALTAAVLNFTVALQSGTASSKTMQVDFAMAAKER